MGSRTPYLFLESDQVEIVAWRIVHARIETALEPKPASDKQRSEIRRGRQQVLVARLENDSLDCLNDGWLSAA